LSPGTASTVFTAPHSEPVANILRRHGARLDAADKSWHLSSPAPYDPPLTYGGWSQAKALGQRIAALLHERDSQQAEAAKSSSSHDPTQLDLGKLTISQDGQAHVNSTQRPKKKRRKIIIHSSPFLRCVQTSTAVAAGISQVQASITPELSIPTPSKNKNGTPGSSSSKATRTKPTSSQPRTFEPLADPNLEILPKPNTGPEKILLRIDAFLGEWLSPEYYADITAPPNSTMMVAGAKADLLRRGDYIQEQPNPNSSRGHFPGGWTGNKAAANTTQGASKGALPRMGSLAQAMPLRERSSSYTGPLGLPGTISKEAVPSLAVPVSTPAVVPASTSSRAYQPPNPSYSVSPADPIPRGYVAHAQEACVQVDFQWDSMREPQNWGDGGEFGDEWSTMHKRFRRGLAGMLQWYKTHGTAPPKSQFPGFMFKEPLRLTPPRMSHTKSDPFPNFSDGSGGPDDDEEELVLVLVTHGAGCNALLGAMTNQPVLMDIGLASLSMAVRRDEPRETPASATVHERRPSVADPGMSDTYEVKLSASIDHLRPGVDPSKPPSAQAQVQAQSPVVLPSPLLDHRRRFTGSSTGSAPSETPFSIGEPYRTRNSSMSSMRRTMSSGSNSRFIQSATNGAAAAPSGGLWSGASTPTGEADTGLHSAHQQARSKPIATASTTVVFSSEKDTRAIPQVDGISDSTNHLTRLDSKEEREVGDKSTPLVSAAARKQSTVSAPGLWGAKAAPKSSNGLWGPPKLDDVYEHRQGPKRRWTMTEREDDG
jgi:broad specificity phosphatase PhoE